MNTLEEFNQSLQTIISQTQNNYIVLIIVTAILWSVFILTQWDRRLLFLGIIPRRLYGLAGIVFAPLLHANFNHIFFNTIPLIVLGNFILFYGLTFFLWVTLGITLLSGLAVWCFGKPGLHIGASGVITGYWGFLVSNIFQQNTVTALILGVVCLYYFAGIFLGVFPGKKGISWEGHFFGLLAGIAVSYLIFVR